MRNKGGRCTVVGAKSDSIGSGRSNTLPLPLASRSLQNCKLPTVLTTVEQIPPSFFKLPFENEPHKRPQSNSATAAAVVEAARRGVVVWVPPPSCHFGAAARWRGRQGHDESDSFHNSSPELSNRRHALVIQEVSWISQKVSRWRSSRAFIVSLLACLDGTQQSRSTENVKKPQPYDCQIWVMIA